MGKLSGVVSIRGGVRAKEAQCQAASAGSVQYTVEAGHPTKPTSNFQGLAWLCHVKIAEVIAADNKALLVLSHGHVPKGSVRFVFFYELMRSIDLLTLHPASTRAGGTSDPSDLRVRLMYSLASSP